MAHTWALAVTSIPCLFLCYCPLLLSHARNVGLHGHDATVALLLVGAGLSTCDAFVVLGCRVAYTTCLAVVLGCVVA
eukprot:1161828-Pelagomonas_calceolata.AAC.8